jgi:hypothetical protein
MFTSPISPELELGMNPGQSPGMEGMGRTPPAMARGGSLKANPIAKPVVIMHIIADFTMVSPYC